MTLKTFGAWTAVLLLVNTAYIAATASPTVFYMSNVLAHVALGVAAWIAALALLFRDPAFRRSRPAQVAVAALTIAVLLAAEIFRRGNLVEHRWVLTAHIATAALAVAALLPYAWKLAAGGGRRRTFGVAYQAGAALLVIVPVAATM